MARKKTPVYLPPHLREPEQIRQPAIPKNPQAEWNTQYGAIDVARRKYAKAMEDLYQVIKNKRVAENERRRGIPKHKSKLPSRNPHHDDNMAKIELKGLHPAQTKRRFGTGRALIRDGITRDKDRSAEKKSPKHVAGQSHKVKTSLAHHLVAQKCLSGAEGDALITAADAKKCSVEESARRYVEEDRSKRTGYWLEDEDWRDRRAREREEAEDEYLERLMYEKRQARAFPPAPEPHARFDHTHTREHCHAKGFKSHTDDEPYFNEDDYIWQETDPDETPLQPAVVGEYATWSKACIDFFEALKGESASTVEFPAIQPALCQTSRLRCLRVNVLKICVHDVERVYLEGPEFSKKFFKVERLKWHPDRFSRASEDAQQKATEMFQLIQSMLDRAK